MADEYSIVRENKKTDGPFSLILLENIALRRDIFRDTPLIEWKSRQEIKANEIPSLAKIFIQFDHEGKAEPATVKIVETTVFKPCPCCGSDNVQKVSSLYNNGSWSSSSIGLGQSSVYSESEYSGSIRSSTYTRNSGSTEIARLLAPPQEPKPPINLIDTIMLPLAIIGLVKKQEISKSNGTEVFLREKATWELEMTIWLRLFYCIRCDTVYDPTDNTHVKPSNLAEILIKIL